MQPVGMDPEPVRDDPADPVPFWLVEAWQLLGRWEREVLRMFVDRLSDGQWQYGRFDPSTETRNMEREASEELADFCVYRIWRRLLR